MRVIAGEFGGRRLVRPKGDQVRPTADRVREAWFSILGPAVAGARVLDLFAGSGALGFEALSRGASHCDFVERHRLSLAALEENVDALGLTARVNVHKGDAIRFAEALEPRAYDLVFADPPYATDYAAQLVTLFRRKPFARILSVEHASTVELRGDDTRKYGDSAVTFCFAEVTGPRSQVAGK